jgi:hypothetical protein
MARIILKRKETAVETAAVVATPAKHPLVQKVEEFNQLRDELLGYMADNAEVVQPLMERFEMYNKLLADVETLMKNLVHLPDGLGTEFTRGTPAKTVSYKADQLPEAVKQMPGVLITKVEVNKDMIDALLKSGQISEADVLPARVDKLSSAPIKTPPKLELAFKRSGK